MDITILKEFIDLAYTLNFRASAERLYISPSTLSKHISKLEDELKTPLFLRTKQSVVLTDNGRAFYERVKPLILQLDNAVSAVKGDDKSLEGVLRVGYFPIAETDFIGAAVARLDKEYPGIYVDLTVDELGNLERGVSNNALDLCVTAKFSNLIVPPDLFFQEIYSDRLSALLPIDNPLAGREYIDFDELMDYPIALPDARNFPDLYNLLTSLIERSGKTPRIASRFSSINAARTIASSKKAIVVYGHFNECAPSNPTLKHIKIINPAAEIRFGAYWKPSNKAPGLDQFISYLIEYFGGVS